MFIARTLADDARLDMVQRNIDFEHKWVILGEGREGGLAIFWKPSMKLEAVDSSHYYIDTWIDKCSTNVL